MALFWHIWSVVILANLAVLTLFFGLATLQFDSINAGLVGEPLSVLAGRTAAPFQAAARIGLPLSTVRVAGALLERARETDDAIIAIHVFDQSGRIVHSTDTAAPVQITPEALASRSAADGAPWHSETEGGFLSSVDIPSRTGIDDGASAGGILTVYPGGGNVTQVRAMAAELASAAIAVVLVATGLSALLLRFGLGRQIRTFEAIDGANADFERGAWRSAAAGPALVGPSDDKTAELRQLLDAARPAIAPPGTRSQPPARM